MSLSIKHIPIALFVAYLAKSIIISTSLADALIVASLASLVAYYDYRLQNKQLAEVKTRLAALEESTSRDIEHLKNVTASMKLNSGLKTTFSQSR